MEITLTVIMTDAARLSEKLRNRSRNNWDRLSSSSSSTSPTELGGGTRKTTRAPNDVEAPAIQESNKGDNGSPDDVDKRGKGDIIGSVEGTVVASHDVEGSDSSCCRSIIVAGRPAEKLPEHAPVKDDRI